MQSHISRRRFLKVSGTAGAAAVAAANSSALAATYVRRRNKELPKPHRSGIEHVVIVMMENRSFDHFFGWLPGANGRQAGLTYLDRAGVPHMTFPLAPDYQGCSHPDPDHSYEGGRIELNGGACDGWLRAGDNDEFAIGYYVPADLPFLANAAVRWTALDGYFSAIMSETWPNKIIQFAGQTDRLENSFEISTLPTIWDRIADHSLRGRYYFSDVPFTALWGTKYLSITRPLASFFADCAAGTLPHLAMVDPRFIGEELGLSNDDHPHADIRNGEVFLSAIYNAVISSPNWRNTVLVINFDEWGGFFEHVPPPLAPIPPIEAALGNDGLRGFRVPCIVVSPWSRRGYVDHGVYDHASVLKMIEWRWHLTPLSVRDSTARNLAEALDFTVPNFTAPPLLVPPGPYGTLCPVPLPVPPNKWTVLSELAAGFGFPLP